MQHCIRSMYHCVILFQWRGIIHDTLLFKHFQQTTYLSYPIYFLSLLLIILFIFLVATVVADYSKDRVKWETLYIWGRGRCVLAIAKKNLVLTMRLVVFWSTSHYVKEKFLVLERGICILLKMFSYFSAISNSPNPWIESCEWTLRSALGSSYANYWYDNSLTLLPNMHVLIQRTIPKDPHTHHSI